MAARDRATALASIRTVWYIAALQNSANDARIHFYIAGRG